MEKTNCHSQEIANNVQLTAELSKRYPRPDFVKGLLSTTHNQRRGLISASVDSVNTIMGQHPFLKQPRWVTAKSSSIFSIVFGILLMIQMIEEFKLMVGEREVESMEDKWKMVLPKLLDGTEELPAYTEEQQWQAVQLLELLLDILCVTLIVRLAVEYDYC